MDQHSVPDGEKAASPLADAISGEAPELVLARLFGLSPEIAGRVTAVSGIVEANHTDGTFEILQPGSTLFVGDVINTSAGSRITCQLSDGHALLSGAEARFVIDSDGHGVRLRLLEGSFVVPRTPASAEAAATLALTTSGGTITLQSSGIVLDERGIRGLRLTVMGDGPLGDVHLANASGVHVLAEPFHVVGVAGGDAAPVDHGPLPCDRLDHVFPEAASLIEVACTVQPATVGTTATRAAMPPLEEMSPGGDPLATVGDALAVTASSTGAFDLSATSATLQEPSLGEVTPAPSSTITTPRHDDEALLQSQQGGPTVPLPQPLILRDWDPSRRWEGIGRAAEIAGSVPELPLEATRQISSRVGEMASLEAVDTSTAQVEQFLGLNQGALSSLAPSRDPGSGAAIKGLDRISLAAGESVRFDVFFDAAGALPLDDFAVFTVGLDQQTMVARIGSIAGAGDFGASGWQTVQFTAAVAGTYTFGFAVINDGPEIASSRLYVDNFRRIESSAFPFQQVETPVIGPQGTIARLAPAPVAVDDAFAIDESGVLQVQGPLGLLDNDRDPDNFDPLILQGIDRTGAIGRVAIGSGNSFTYDPAGRFESLAVGERGIDHFSYIVDGGNGLVSRGTVTVTIHGLNDPPVAVADTAVAVEGGPPIAIPVTTNDLDVDSDDDIGSLTVISATAQSGARVTISGQPGSPITYFPVAPDPQSPLGLGQTATDVITYTVADRHGATATGQVTVRITGTNDSPIAAADAAVLNEDAAMLIDVLANDRDPDGGGALSITAIDASGSQGQVAIASGSAIRYSAAGRFDQLALGESASDHFAYTVGDGQGGSGTAAVAVTVTGLNDAPVATADFAAVAEGGAPVSIDVLANDDDIDSDDDASSLRVVAASAASGAEVRIPGGPGQAITYLPATGSFPGVGGDTSAVDVITYTIEDRHGARSVGTVTVTVGGVNDPVTASPDHLTASEDTVLDLPPPGLLGNDFDPDGLASLRIIDIAGTAVGGTVPARIVLASGAGLSARSDGSLRYDPIGALEWLADGETVTESFTYTVGDGTSSDVARVDIVVAGVNDAPVAGPDQLTIGEDGPALSVPVLANDEDIDSDDTAASLRIVSAQSASGVAVAFATQPGGSLTYDPGDRFQTLAVGATGVDTVTYTVSDRHGATATGTLKVTVTGRNDAPEAAADHYNTAARQVLETPAQLGLLANDRDQDLGDSLKLTAVNGDPAAVGATIVLPSGALLTVAADGRFAYDPNGRFDGLDPLATGQDQFRYTIEDENGAVDTESVEIRVFNDNALPLAADDAAETTADKAVRIPVLFNDVDPENALLRIASVDTVGTRGSVRINADGTLSYDPSGQFDGLAPGETATDHFRYIVDDNVGGRDEATVTVTVHGAGSSGSGGKELLQSFEAPGGLFVAGWERLPGEQGGTPPVNLVTSFSAGGIVFVPTEALGMANLSAQGSTAVGPGTLRSPIEAFLNLPGGALPDDDGRHAGQSGDRSEPNAGSAVRTTLVAGANDVDAGGRLTLALDWNFISAESVAANAPGRNDYAVMTISDGSTSKVFTLADARDTGLGASGWRTTTYSILDDFRLPAAGALTLTIGFAVINDESSANPSSLLLDNVRLNPDLDAALEKVASADGGRFETFRERPTAADDGPAAALTTTEDALLSLPFSALTGNDRGSSGANVNPLRITAVDSGTASAQVTLGADAVHYDPRGRLDRLAAGDSVTETFVYAVTDGNRGQATARATVTVTGVNDAPVAVADQASAVEGGFPVVIPVLANDLDPDRDGGPDALRVIAAGTSSGAQVTFTGRPGAGIVYDPGNAFPGLAAGETATDIVSYTVEDGHGAPATGSVTVIVTGGNTAPVAIDDSVQIDQNTVVTIDVAANDQDADPGDRPAITAVNGTPAPIGQSVTLASGAIVQQSAGGVLRYDPGQAFAALRAREQAIDTFSYRINDNGGAIDEATVAVTVLGLNDAPVAVLDQASTGADSLARLTAPMLLGNDTDPDRGDLLHLVGIDGSGSEGAVGIEGGDIVYDPRGRFDSLGQGESTVDSFLYRIADDEGLTAEGRVQVQVLGVNDAPTAGDDAASTSEDTGTKIRVLDNDRDPDLGDVLTVAGIDRTGTVGEVVINSDGSLQYDPAGRFDHLAAGQSAVDVFRYTIADAHGSSATATVTVAINGRSDIERLVESFEGAFPPFDSTSTFVSFVSSYQEPDGGHGSFRPTDPASGPARMAQLEARGSVVPDLERFFGLPPGSLPHDSDGSSSAFGSALRVRTAVQAGDEISFDWMFDARDYVAAPPDGFADNDYAVVAITEGANTQLFKLSDVRQVGDQGASGWRSSVYTAASAGTLVIGFGVVNDRTASPIAENSFLLVDNLRLNREFDDSYQVVQSQGQGALDTLVQITT